MKVELGDLVKDRITGFTGIVVAVTQWITGCDRVTVQPNKLDKDGKVLDSQAFDVPMLDVIKKKKISTEPAGEKKETVKKGGPRPNVFQRQDITHRQ